MAFSTALKSSLQTRRTRVQADLAKGEGLERVLSRYLIDVETLADRELLTSVLLLDRDGERMFHGAAPNLPAAYCRAIDGIRIGPRVGSCGTAAYLGRPIYVTDIAADPLWTDYRDLALMHGLRACWSTPIFDADQAVIGTFAIYHRTVGSPSPEEIDAIDMIRSHVADAIICARNTGACKQPLLRLASEESVSSAASDSWKALSQAVHRLESQACELDRYASVSEPGDAADAVRAAATDCRRLIAAVRGLIDPQG